MSGEGPGFRHNGASDSSSEVEVALILEGYLADLEAGRPADPDALIAAHPQLAGPLRACLEVMGAPFGEPGEPMGSTGGTRTDEFAPRVLLSEPTGEESAPVLTPPGLAVRAGRYQVLGEIARGGMGAVLRAATPTSAASWP
jgi:eukaryotic-like serine/threonine-protein kinase